LKINNGFDFCTDIHITNYFLYNNMKQASKGYSGKLASAESSQLAGKQGAHITHQSIFYFGANFNKIQY